MFKKVKKINEHATLVRDDRTGIAKIQDGAMGISHSIHANISSTGSVRGMRVRGYWGKKDRAVRAGSFTYNIDSLVSDENSEYDKILKAECRCAAYLERRKDKPQVQGR